MIDHLTARRTLATAVDFSLPADDAEALAVHLRACLGCRSFNAALRADAAVLRDLDFGPVPMSVRATVAIAAERGGGGGIGRWMGLVAVGALLLVAVGSGALGAGGSPTTGLGSNGNAIHWQTEVVDLQAADFWIQASGQRFTAVGTTVDVHSDPGNATYRTLEATWHEHGVEMRLNFYFGGDASSWWVSEIRIYDGRPQGEWLGWKGIWFKAPIGAGWAGDLDLATAGGALHIGGLQLRSTAFDGVNEPPDGAPVPLVQFDLFEPDGPLYCSGILQMPPAQAEQVLLGLGYKLSWRYVINNGGYWEIRKDAPEGVMQAPVGIGSEGELIIPVIKFGDKGAEPIPLPSDCPPVDGASPVLVPLAPTPAD